MPGLNDSLTIGILLTLIFGAVAFYLYSRMSQNEKRLGLLENLLLTLKMTTEASLSGPDSVEAVSSPAPLGEFDVDEVSEEDYAELLQHMPVEPSASAPASASAAAPSASAEPSAEVVEEVPSGTKVDVNYASLSTKELQALAKSKGLSNIPTKKKDIIDLLKGNGVPVSEAPVPLVPAADELSGVAFS
jgi:hypothetical protein